MVQLCQKYMDDCSVGLDPALDNKLLCSYIFSESSAVQQKTVWWILSEKFKKEVHSFGLRTESVCMCCCCSDRRPQRQSENNVWKPENFDSCPHFHICLIVFVFTLPAELRSFPNRSVLDRRSVSYTPSTTRTDMLHFSCLIYKQSLPVFVLLQLQSLSFVTLTWKCWRYMNVKS